MYIKKNLLFLILYISIQTFAQNVIPIPDTLTGNNFNLTLHTDSVQFLPGQKTFTNAVNQYSYLGPTLLFNKGEEVSINVINNLNDTSTIHWHGLHVPAMDDGGPHTVIMEGATWNPQFTILNNAATYWYHPHLHMKTGQQAMRGVAGLIIIRDEQEADLDLPRTYGIDDFPIIVQTQQFDSANQILWRGMNDSIILVNGTQNPMLNLPGQIIRMRLLNASQERNFNFGFSQNKTFYVIATDGGLLSAPVPVTRIRLSPGERAEILINFSAMIGQTAYLMSYASEFPMGVQGGTPMPGMDSSMYSPINGIDFNILQLNIGSPNTSPVTNIPSTLVPFEPWLESQADITRQITITAENMMNMDGPFFFNDSLFNMDRIDYTIPLNNIEIWSLTNESMVAHPFHIHDVQFFILDRDGVSPMPEESGYKDVVMIAPNETVRFITKFENFADSAMPYMYHCHILMHEDDGMMGQFVVVQTTSGLDENFSDYGLSIYPNPVNCGANFTVEAMENIKSISVFDMYGKLLLKKQLDNRSTILSLPEGNSIYFLEVVTENDRLCGKILTK
jgi:bilirubin oxidase